MRGGRVSFYLEQWIAVKQLVLHIDTWYTSRGVGKEQE